MSHIALLGCGSWGTTLAQILANKGESVRAWHYRKEFIDQLNSTRVNPLLPNVKLNSNIIFDGQNKSRIFEFQKNGPASSDNDNANARPPFPSLEIYNVTFTGAVSANAGLGVLGNVTVNGSWTNSLNMGDQMDIRAKGYQKSNGSKVVTPLCHNKQQYMGNYGVLGYFTTDSYVEYTVRLGDNEDYHDANIKHKVDVLGMQFDDIKIPASYKDKVQGFRIYRAKRTYSNKTIAYKNAK